jgi:hypothetical protein
MFSLWVSVGYFESRDDDITSWGAWNTETRLRVVVLVGPWGDPWSKVLQSGENLVLRVSRVCGSGRLGFGGSEVIVQGLLDVGK